MMDHRTLKDTPTWAIAAVCFALILLSLLVEAALHLLTKFLETRNRKALNQAVQKIKTELMQMGFISLLLTVGEVPISKFCVSKAVGNSFLPCKDLDSSTVETAVANDNQITGLNATIPIEETLLDELSCEAKGMVSLISRDGIMQLHILIFVLASFHVLFCVMTMCLGTTKMKRWKAWEEETRTLQYQIANDPRRFRLTRQTSFGRRHLQCWSNHPLLLWPACFLRQFRGSVTKADYFTLRNGFITAHMAEGSNFNFRKFLGRTFDEDFEVVVEIRFWIWLFSIFFIFFSAHTFYNYFWLPFLPLLMALVIGTKLQVIITKMCLESRYESVIVRGTMLVKPNDNLFWFGRPQLLLHLIHFILFQNSFQLATFTWAWYEFGLRSCFHRETEDIVLWIIMGVIVQFLCGYVTLPLYTLVTQMGSGIKQAVFTEHVTKGLKHWHGLARRNISRSKSSSRRPSSEPVSIDTIETSLSDLHELDLEGNNQSPSMIKCAPLIYEITKDEVHPMTTHGNYDGEISFGMSWKEHGSGKEIKEIALACDRTNSEILELTDKFPRHPSEATAAEASADEVAC